MSPRLAAFEMAGFAETNPPISLRLPRGKGMADDKLLVKHVSGVKTICGGIEYGVFRVSPAAGSALKQVRANSVDLQFVTDTSGLRSVCGIVASAIGGLGDSGLAPYQLIDRDALSLRDKTINMRVFRNAREIEITNTILCDWRDANSVARAFEFDLGQLKTYRRILQGEGGDQWVLASGTAWPDIQNSSPLSSPV